MIGETQRLRLQETLEEVASEYDADLDVERIISHLDGGSYADIAEEEKAIVRIGLKRAGMREPQPLPRYPGTLKYIPEDDEDDEPAQGHVGISVGDLEGLSGREKIRRCSLAGMAPPDIARFLHVRPQMVHNTLNALKKADSSVVRCRECGRPLTDEESKKSGLGPICSHKE